MISRCVAPALMTIVVSWLADGHARAEDANDFAVARRDDRLVISFGERLIAEYVWKDERIRRPYFSNVKAPDGIAVTRPYPPREGIDPVDHDTMHPGIWLAFGDIDGNDFWRNKAAIEHVEFVEPPRATDEAVTFAVRNRYRAGERILATEVSRHAIVRRPHGLRFAYDVTITPTGKAIVLGDQEEMGFGVRVATPLRVAGGSGRILSGDGKMNEREVRGTTARWADYSGVIDGRRVGVLIVPHPENFRASWWHARDYGLLVANPFGREALTGGEKSRVRVERDKPLRLRFAVLAYSEAETEPLDREVEYRAYVEPAISSP